MVRNRSHRCEQLNGRLMRSVGYWSDRQISQDSFSGYWLYGHVSPTVRRPVFHVHVDRSHGWQRRYFRRYQLPL